MHPPSIFHSFSARLVTGIVMLVMVTTLSAGVPAYWLARAELEQQAWDRLNGAERSTRSLLLAEQERLENLLALLTERPTLRRLLREDAPGDLADYLHRFERQSALDFILLCSTNGPSTTGRDKFAPCPQSIPTGFVLYDLQPAIVAALPIRDEQPGQQRMTAMAGIWMDERFLRQMASKTGVEQSVLLLDGTRRVSTISHEGESTTSGEELLSRERGAQPIGIGGQQFYTDRLPLAADDEQPTMFLEIALSVDELVVTERRSLGILAVSTGLIIVLGTVLGIWTMRRLTNPLEQLTRTAEAISTGDLATPIPTPSGPTEVRTLAAALHRSQASMLAALDDLAQTRNWLDNLVQSIVEGVVTIDGEGYVTFINEKAADLASLEPEEAIDCHVDHLLPAVDEAGHRLSLQRLSRTGRHRITLIRSENEGAQPVRRPGQRAVRRLGRPPSPASEPIARLDVTTTHLRSPDGEEMQTALVLRDITEEEALRHLRSYFLANITHEFRTPLSTLNASMELLMDEDELSAAEMRELLKPIHLSLVSLQTLIDNLLESSRIEAGRFSIRRQSVDLNQVITDAVRVVQPLLERRNQTLSLTEPAFLPSLMGDPARLTQVLVNLLSNASKYSVPNTTIDLGVEQIGGRLHVSVADWGPGIPAEERKNLFRRFVRLDTRGSEQYGIGLGLHVVKTTVEAHGGRVGVDDHPGGPGGGSVFWFDLPIERKESKA